MKHIAAHRRKHNACIQTESGTNVWTKGFQTSDVSCVWVGADTNVVSIGVAPGLKSPSRVITPDQSTEWWSHVLFDLAVHGAYIVVDDQWEME